MAIGIDNDDNVDNEYLVVDRVGNVDTGNVEEMSKVVQQDVSVATANQVSTSEVSTTEEVAKTVDEAGVAEFFDEMGKVSEVETDEQLEFSLQEEEEKIAHGALMQAIIDADEVLQARVAILYDDRTLTKADRVQRLADLINQISEEVEFADLLNARSEEVALNELIQPTKQARSQKRKINPTKKISMGDMKVYLIHQGGYNSTRLRGMTYEEVERLYNRIKRYVDSFINKGTEDTPSKKQKIIEDKPAEKKNDSQRKEDSSSDDHMMNQKFEAQNLLQVFAPPLNAMKTPSKAYVNKVSKEPLETSVNIAGSKSTGPKWHILSAVSKSLSAYRNKMKSPTTSSPFDLKTEDRAARRKQKLEEKINEKDTRQVQQETKLKEKAEREFRKMRQRFCFKARPSRMTCTSNYHTRNLPSVNVSHICWKYKKLIAAADLKEKRECLL
ncbi:TPX2 domain-containing protein [Artemisia annua]|uniref:TPX2 domain-containing protein n=1 Tax=Artemisia annua TaxID=35608 RepID=A0A2U1PZU8_ARTAN|nr:TPX2 domain-containing protein [Artemisia annua]